MCAEGTDALEEGAVAEMGDAARTVALGEETWLLELPCGQREGAVYAR